MTPSSPDPQGADLRLQDPAPPVSPGTEFWGKLWEGRGVGHLVIAVASLVAVLAMVACAGHTGL